MCWINANQSYFASSTCFLWQTESCSVKRYTNILPHERYKIKYTEDSREIQRHRFLYAKMTFLFSFFLLMTLRLFPRLVGMEKLNSSQCSRSVKLGAGTCRLEDYSRMNNSITCSSLQEVLSLLSSVGSAKMKGRENCIEIILGETDQVIQGVSLSLNESLVLNGGTEEVTVLLATSTLSFAGADYVAIEGIQFISFDGAAVSFDNTTYIYIINSTFR